MEFLIAESGLWGEAARKRKTLIIDDYDSPSTMKRGLPKGHAPITRFTSIPVFDGDKIVAMVGLAHKHTTYTNHDITTITLLFQGMWNSLQKLKAKELLERENERLKEIEELRKFFFSMATHELKTPLNLLNCTSNLIMENRSFSKNEVQEFMKMIQEGTIKLNKLITQLLDYSRIENDGLKLARSPQKINPIIQKACEDIAWFIEQRNHDLVLNLNSNQICNMDPFRIELVLANLINNAIKNTPPGGVVELKSQDVGPNLLVSVEDTGIGLNKNEMDYLFKKFSTYNRKDCNENIITKGSGLGLFISKEIIKAHGGKIWAESKGYMKGSTFFFSIPGNKRE